MPPLIKDYVEFKKVNCLPSVASSRLEEILQSFLPTDGLIELINRLLDAITKKLRGQVKSQMEPASVLLTGGHGTGKSHLLSVVFGLIRGKGTLAPSINDPRIHSSIAALRQIDPLCIWIDLSHDTTIPLPELVLNKIHSEYRQRFDREVIDPRIIPGINTIKAHELITFNVTTERPILLVIDGLSRRAEQRDVQQLNTDIEFLSFMGYSSKAAKFFLIVAAHEDFFSPKSPLGIDSLLMAQTLENFRIEWIDRACLREIIVRQILRKNSRQQQDVMKLHAFIKSKLPNFAYSESDFCDAYPFHPLIFELSEKLRSKINSFSLLEFVITTYPKVASHRAVSLITLDNIFDRTEFELRTSPVCHRLYSIYQALAEQAVPRLQDRYKLWGKMLLKATFLFTLADRNPTVRDLADSLLLFEDSEGLSYNTVGMLLGQLEKAVEQGFTTADDRLDRTYRLGSADMRAELNKYLNEIVQQIPETDPRLASLLPAAGRHIFPDWPSNFDSPSTRSHELSLKVSWRGTQRAGLMLLSQNFIAFPGNDNVEAEDLSGVRGRLPIFFEPFHSDGNPSANASSAEAQQNVEWLLWLEPIQLSKEPSTNLKTSMITEVRWLPDLPSAEDMELLKRVLALHLSDKSASSDFAAADMHSLREELKGALTNLFRELYLFRGKIVTGTRAQSLNQDHLACRSFRSFISYIFKPNFDELYPLHPDFGGEQLTEGQVVRINRDLFSGQDPTNPEVQRLAGKFALPLGLVSQTEGLYELNLTLTPPIFLTQLMHYLESLDAVERPIHSLLPLLNRSPFGLTQHSLELILMGLVADGQIELFDPQTGSTVSRENSSSVESLESYTLFKRMPSHKDYPSEVLTQWCRLISGKLELTDISTSRGREAAVGALAEWHRGWIQMTVSRKLEGLPNELLTTQVWRKFTWIKQRFEKVAEIINLVLQKEMPLIQGMAKVIDLFGENVNLLEKASRDLVELFHFLSWMDFFLAARKYVLTAEKTHVESIERARQKLLSWIDAPHEMIINEQRLEFDTAFREFSEQFIDFYATQHDQSVGPTGRFEELNNLVSSRDLRNLQLLSALPLGDSSYLDSLDEWIAEFRDYQCTLPVRDVLRSQPNCQCSFRLTRPLDMAQVVEDLRSFLQLGISHHRQVLNHYRSAIDSRIGNDPPDANGTTQILKALLHEGPLLDLTQEAIDRLIDCLDDHLRQEKLAPPMQAIAPSTSFTKRELQSRVQRWLDTLSDEEGIVFSLKDF